VTGERLIVGMIVLLFVGFLFLGFASCREKQQCEAAGGYESCHQVGIYYILIGKVMMPQAQMQCECVGARK